MADQQSTIESTLTRAWMQRGLLAVSLWPLSLLFRMIVSVRRALYALGLLPSTRLPVPVIIVGNLFVGGTGKTPFVIWLVAALRAAGYTPGIISRGYGASHDRPQQVTPTSDPAQSGDEPLLLVQRTGCPLMVGRDRAAAGRALVEAFPDVDILVSDDGLQHYALQRDVEIVLFDERGAGNGWMLPAGPLREPVSRRRDFTVVNAIHPPSLTNSFSKMQLTGGFAENLADRTQRVALGDLPRVVPSPNASRPPKMLAAAGIGNPSRFFSLLRTYGLTFDELPLSDHFDYKTSPFINKDADVILITEKDAVKCAVFEPPESLRRFWVVPVTAQVDAALAGQIVEKCRGSRIA